MTLSQNIFTTFASRIIVIGLGLISGIIVARTFGPEAKGILALLSLIIGVTTQFGSLGLPGANTYFVGKDPSVAPKILGNSLWLSMVLGGGAAGGIYLLTKVQPDTFGSLESIFINVTLVSIPFLLLAQLVQNILIGQQRIFVFNVIQVINQIVITFGVITLVLLHYGILSIVLLSTAVGIITALAYWLLAIRDNGVTHTFDRQLFKKTIRYGIKGYITTFLAYLILRSDIYVINLFHGESATGIYSLATGFADLIYILPMSISMVLFPRLANNQYDSGPLTAKVVRATTLVMLIICTGAAVIAAPLIVTLYGAAFTSSVIPFLILLPAIFFFSLETIISQNLGALGFPLYIIYIWCATAVINILLNFLFIPEYGIIAAAVSSLVSYFFVYVLMTYFFLKENKLRFSALIPTPADAKTLVNTIMNIRKR
ncbi:hypothetical protein COV82_06220 [Candidatus Peregrinibacteria bacterium CG11_big_fil_rev_8_21_14_0_20_46_8]|nr:MAG: hypothetical protein COV82_06220 [Candidatus Peregrinibacteria bacterium CG11_big_fil_rev_8_21_14_0_20_46_8]